MTDFSPLTLEELKEMHGKLRSHFESASKNATWTDSQTLGALGSVITALVTVDREIKDRHAEEASAQVHIAPPGR